MITSRILQTGLICFTTVLFTSTVYAAGSDEKPDGTSGATAKAPDIDNSKELPVRMIPNIPSSSEAYYGPDSYHFIVQTLDKDAQQPEGIGDELKGSLTYIFTDDGKNGWRITDRGRDACSYIFPDRERVIYTSTRDNMDMPLGDWSNPQDYPQGAEIYSADMDGKNVTRLTNNEYYEAEVAISPNGQWITFVQEIDHNINIWRMRADGSDKQQVTFTDDWQPGAPIYMADSETILFQGWRRSEQGKIKPTPMTVFTIKHDGSELTQRTFDNGMYWGPAPIADGRHYLYTTVLENNNFELFLGDLGGEKPRRLTYSKNFDGMKSISPDGKKMIFNRPGPDGKTLYLHVMDLSSLNMGPENYKGIPETPVPADAILVTDFTVKK